MPTITKKLYDYKFEGNGNERFDYFKKKVEAKEKLTIEEVIEYRSSNPVHNMFFADLGIFGIEFDLYNLLSKSDVNDVKNHVELLIVLVLDGLSQSSKADMKKVLSDFHIPFTEEMLTYYNLEELREREEDLYFRKNYALSSYAYKNWNQDHYNLFGGNYYINKETFENLLADYEDDLRLVQENNLDLDKLEGPFRHNESDTTYTDSVVKDILPNLISKFKVLDEGNFTRKGTFYSVKDILENHLEKLKDLYNKVDWENNFVEYEEC